ncbi:DUF3769 domain-containing protein [Chamaesiphon sp. VAR_69_metabat_338]|uniref:DUF3769 domain-containing protein n=1 Tax=Chamaesiphon sp. VAR_69_metabat_338 TaxID=2964704 RepID=UPI00286E958B|nr:DUF3769 domain-containing protein [Chamaesiphon sp. VAR_69_metabat_338]
MGKKSDRDVTQRVWKTAWYLLLLSYYSIGFSLRPIMAESVPPPAIPAKLAPVRRQSAPLTYKVVQDGTTGTPQIDIAAPNGTIELNASQTEFDNNTQIVSANGNVIVRFNKALLKADRLRVNLKTRIATAEGNVSLLRGKQTLYGSQFEYNFEKDSGNILEARGDVYQPTLVRDLNVLSPQSASAPANVTDKPFTEPLLSDRLREDQPVTNIRSTGSIGITTNDRDIEYQPTLKPSGTITRLRFQADKVDFVSDLITAEKVRITNDPFSPPELQVKADRAQFKTVNSEESEITVNNARVNVENNFEVPIPRDRFVLNKLGKDAASNPFANFGFDTTDRGGFYLQTSYYPVFDPRFRVTITPQYYLQRAVSGFKIFDPSVFGVATNVVGNFGPDTTVEASTLLTGFDLDNFPNRFRGRVDIRQNLSLFGYPHQLTGEAVYRQQIFNGSLGYQDVQSSFGGILTSSIIPIGGTGVNLNYQVGGQLITANTDRQNIISANTALGLATLERYQTEANLTKSFRLWEGRGLPADNKETYNYSPIPVVPYLQLNTGIKGGYSGYSNGDSQSFIGYNVGIQGQLGNFSKSSFDYTGFNINYYQQYPGAGTSPFLFDRLVNNRVLSAGINQQISGPFRLGIQTSFDVNSGQQISTDYYVEYSRRTYNLVVRYNPVLGLGSIGFRLNDFNWDGSAPKF